MKISLTQFPFFEDKSHQGMAVVNQSFDFLRKLETIISIFLSSENALQK